MGKVTGSISQKGVTGSIKQKGVKGTITESGFDHVFCDSTLYTVDNSLITSDHN